MNSIKKQLAAFFWRHIRDLREGGLPVLFRKLHSLFLMALTILTIPIVILVRAVRPILLIRFRQLPSAIFGHFVCNTEVYLCECDVGMHGKRVLDIFYHDRYICNQQLKKMWDRVLHVSRIAGLLDKANRWLPGGQKHVVLWRPNQNRDIFGVLTKTRPHLVFTAEEERFGYAALLKLGIPEGRPFVCIHSRSAAYRDTIFPDISWRYHNYRNSDIDNFVVAAEELTCRGYAVVRTGFIVEKSLRTTNPMIIDYAKKGRTDFLDVFLGAKCRFYLGDPCGFDGVAMASRRPLAIVNSVPLEYIHSWAKDCLVIPKKLWLRTERRFLTFREILDSEIGRFLRSEQYERLNIDVIENTPEEILALAVEMDERLKGNWRTTEEDEKLQRRFWSFFKPSKLNGVFLSRIGTEFLRQNKGLLE